MLQEAGNAAPEEVWEEYIKSFEEFMEKSFPRGDRDAFSLSSMFYETAVAHASEDALATHAPIIDTINALLDNLSAQHDRGDHSMDAHVAALMDAATSNLNNTEPRPAHRMQHLIQAIVTIAKLKIQVLIGRGLTAEEKQWFAEVLAPLANIPQKILNLAMRLTFDFLDPESGYTLLCKEIALHQQWRRNRVLNNLTQPTESFAPEHRTAASILMETNSLGLKAMLEKILNYRYGLFLRDTSDAEMADLFNRIMNMAFRELPPEIYEEAKIDADPSELSVDEDVRTYFSLIIDFAINEADKRKLRVIPPEQDRHFKLIGLLVFYVMDDAAYEIIARGTVAKEIQLPNSDEVKVHTILRPGNSGYPFHRVVPEPVSHPVSPVYKLSVEILQKIADSRAQREKVRARARRPRKTTTPVRNKASSSTVVLVGRARSLGDETKTHNGYEAKMHDA